jgi:hypothetical protein
LGFSGLLVGCARSSNAKTTPVEGVVTFLGKPVPGAIVTFIPENAPLATGETDSEGRFVLMTRRPGDGTVPGNCRVTIAKFVLEAPKADDQEGATPTGQSLLPEKYASIETSGLSAQVEAGKKNSFTFDLNP